jgi:Ethylbenzene dehydrogenase
VFSRWIEPILMQGEVWTIHFIASTVMFACASAYAVYLNRAALLGRNALGRLRVFLMEAPSKLRWQAFNVAMHWKFYLLTVVMMATGILLYLGWGGWVVVVHAAVAITLVAYMFLHILGHFMVGGWAQIFRVFLPARLDPGPMVKRYPLMIALGIGALSSAAMAGLDFGTRETLFVEKVSAPPKLDGMLDDAVWAKARHVTVHTQQGSNLANNNGESDVEIRAVQDGTSIHFAFRWQDPTRSVKRIPMIKRADGWHMLHNKADLGDESAHYEDKFSVLFSHTDAFAANHSIHMGERPLADQPGPLNKRGLHYTEDGSYLDVWQWKAARAGLLGGMDDMYFGPPIPAKEAEWKGARYSAGYTNDPGKAAYSYLYKTEPAGGFKGPVTVLRLPKDHAAMTAKLGKIDISLGGPDEEGAQWWMYPDETVPYSPEHDATIPVGTVMPTTLITGPFEGDRGDLAAGAKWKDGWWTLEVSRKLVSNSKYDLDFSKVKPVYVWVSVFDRNQTRHTRHVRPIKLEMK